MNEKCSVCSKPVAEAVMDALETFGLPPLCSMDCVSVAAELHAVEMIPTNEAFVALFRDDAQ